MEDRFNPQPTTSGNVASVGFDESTKEGCLDFNSGSTYIYQGCTQEEADQIAQSPSATTAFRAIWGSKPYRKVS